MSDKKIRIKVLPHVVLCPTAVDMTAEPGTSLCDALLDNGIEIEHACEQSCACTTCHVYIEKGFDQLEEPSEQEEDLLDMAWGLKPNSRLSCQVQLAQGDNLIIEIPRYTINQISENR